MGVSEGRAVRSAESALSGASKRLRREDLTQSNNPTSLLSAVRRLPTFLGREQGAEVPYTRWIATSAVFPAPHSRVLSGEAIRAEGERILADVESAHDLPPLHANAVINAEWGGSIIETRDRLALAVYAAVGLRHVPVKITAPPHRFIDANLTIPFPPPPPALANLRISSARIANDLGLRGRGRGPIPFVARQDEATSALWRVHDCLRDFLLEGELIRDDERRQFTLKVSGESLFPWLMDERLAGIGDAFRVAHPNQSRHGRVPTVPKGEELVRRGTLPPSISSDD